MVNLAWGIVVADAIVIADVVVAAAITVMCDASIGAKIEQSLFVCLSLLSFV